MWIYYLYNTADWRHIHTVVDDLQIVQTVKECRLVADSI